MIPVKDFSEEKHLLMATSKGVVKKTNLSEYKNYRKGGIIGINIDEGDALIVGQAHPRRRRSRHDHPCGHVPSASTKTPSATKAVPPAGVRGISLKGKDDYVVHH